MVGFEVATRFFILVSFCFRLVAVKLKERTFALSYFFIKFGYFVSPNLAKRI